jgi:hypothetical protein
MFSGGRDSDIGGETVLVSGVVGKFPLEPPVLQEVLRNARTN